MYALMQAAATMPHPGPSLGDLFRSLTPFALMALGWMQARSIAERTEMRAEVKALREEVTALNVHVGVDGNGIIARLDALAITLDQIKTELAENRGASRKGA